MWFYTDWTDKQGYFRENPRHRARRVNQHIRIQKGYKKHSLTRNNNFPSHQTFINLPLRPVAGIVAWSYSRLVA